MRLPRENLPALAPLLIVLALTERMVQAGRTPQEKIGAGISIASLRMAIALSYFASKKVSRLLAQNP